MKSLLKFTCIATLVTLCAAASAAPPTDPVIGSWKLNVAASKFSPGPALKSQSRVYSMSADGITLAAKSVDADGKETSTSVTYMTNGKEFPVKGNPNWDTITAKQINAHTAEFSFKKGGKDVGTGDRVVSKNGKTLTSNQRGTNAKGEKYDDKMIFDRE